MNRLSVSTKYTQNKTNKHPKEYRLSIYIDSNVNTATLPYVICVVALVQSAVAFSPVLQLPQTMSSVRSPNGSQLFAFGDNAVLSSDQFQSKVAQRSDLKKQILDLASKTQRGLTATDEQKQTMQNLFQQLEALNPTCNPLIVAKDKPSINGDWSLEYTTSDSILGRGGSPRIGPIIQNINTTTLSVINSEVVRYFSLFNIPRSVTVELSPVDRHSANVKVKMFIVGPIRLNAPDSLRSSFNVTYLDEDMRLTRGDKGNIFVLTRM